MPTLPWPSGVGKMRRIGAVLCILHGTTKALISWLVNRPSPPGHVPPLLRNKGLIAGLIKGRQWLISPDHKALFLGGVRWGGGRLTSHRAIMITAEYKSVFQQRNH